MCSSDRFVEIWLEHGYRALLEAIAHEDPAWLSVQFEAARRVRTDELFREQLSRLDDDTKAERESRYARLRGVARDDVPIEVITQFLGTLERPRCTRLQPPPHRRRGAADKRNSKCSLRSVWSGGSGVPATALEPRHAVPRLLPRRAPRLRARRRRDAGKGAAPKAQLRRALRLGATPVSINVIS